MLTAYDAGVKFLLLAIIIVLFVAWMMRGRVQDNIESRQQNKKLLSELDPALIAKILFHLGTGNRIAAVNELRMATGLQRAASEWLVDAIRKGRGPQQPQRQQQPAPGANADGTTVPGEATVVSEERIQKPASE